MCVYRNFYSFVLGLMTRETPDYPRFGLEWHSALAHLKKDTDEPEQVQTLRHRLFSLNAQAGEDVFVNLQRSITQPLKGVHFDLKPP